MTPPRAAVTGAGLALLALLTVAPLYAEDKRIDIGVRANAMHVSSSVTEQMIGAGVVWRYHVEQNWFVAFSLDSYEYDIQHPLRLMGSVTALDGISSPLQIRTVVFSTAVGRNRDLGDSRFALFWHAGIGVGVPSVSSVSGLTPGGQAYDLHTETGTEIHLSASLGTAYQFSPHWALLGAARIEHQFVDLEVSNHVSGETMTIDSLTPIGVYISLNYRF